MKKRYINPELNIEKLMALDVLGASNPVSGTTDGQDDWGFSPDW